MYQLDLTTSRQGGSYYVLMRIDRIEDYVLLDSGATHSVMPTEYFDLLSPDCRRRIRQTPGVGKLADGNQVRMHGEITLPLKVGGAEVWQTFLVGDVTEHIIIGMDFFHKHECILDFTSFKLKVGKNEVNCYNRHGQPFVVQIQMISECRIPSKTEMSVKARLNESPAVTPSDT